MTTTASKRSSQRPLAALLLLAVLLAGCATAPETGRRQLLLVSPSEETALGLQAFNRIKNQKPIVARGKAADQVRDVGRRIARVAPLPDADWEFVLFQDDSPNAFALPGGKVGVHTGILPIAKTEAGLATVLAHEVAHAVARHSAERMSQALAAQLGSSVLSVALGTEAGIGGDLAMQAYGLGARYGVLLPYSRTHELEADRLGLLYMARAGFDPREALGFWQRFAADNTARGGSPPEFLSTHPVDSRRIEAIKDMLPQALAEYAQATGGHRGTP
jgi:predicted Zn-dependent protease